MWSFYQNIANLHNWHKSVERKIHRNYFLISAQLSNSITSDNRDPNNALNSDKGVVWGLLCLHPSTIKPRLTCILGFAVNFSFNRFMAIMQISYILIKRSHLNLLLWNRWTKLNQIWLFELILTNNKVAIDN
jgi:hypothetical protein